MTPRKLSVTAGVSYLIIFFAAIFANFFVLESLFQSPLETVQTKHMIVRWGILAFLITVVFDVVVAWALNEWFKQHPLSGLSTYFGDSPDLKQRLKRKNSTFSFPRK